MSVGFLLVFALITIPVAAFRYSYKGNSMKTVYFWLTMERSSLLRQVGDDGRFLRQVVISACVVSQEPWNSAIHN